MLVGEVFARMGLDDKQYKKGLDRLEGITQKKAMTLGSIFKKCLFCCPLGSVYLKPLKGGFKQ